MTMIVTMIIIMKIINNEHHVSDPCIEQLPD